jgi:hypothetical protein
MFIYCIKLSTKELIMSKVFTFLLLVVAFISNGQSTQNTPAWAFTSGNLVIVRVGSGVGTLPPYFNAGAIFLDEYNTSGVLVKSTGLPINGGYPGNFPIVLAAISPTEGFINRSSNGQYLVLGGYAVSPGSQAVNTSPNAWTSQSVRRTVAIVDAAGNLNILTQMIEAFNNSDIRSVASENGTNLWMTGANDLVVMPSGTQSITPKSLRPNASVNGMRALTIFNGQLYVSFGPNASGYSLAKVGTGLPIAGSQAVVNLPGMPTTNYSFNQFLLFDTDGNNTCDVIYVADDGATSGGIAKYSLVNGIWKLNNIVGDPADAYRGLTGTYDVATGTASLYAIRKGGTTITGGGELVSLVDNTGYNANMTAAPTLLAVAPANTAFRGIALTPVALVPVTLKAFTGTYNNEKAMLVWDVANETNLRGYEIEKSLDANNFVNVGFVAASNANSYTFSTDQKTTVVYYRLKMVDKDGSFKYSNTISINGKEGVKLDLYPNPAKNTLVLLHPKADDKATATISSINGKRLLAQSITANTTQTTLDVSKLPAGTYLVVYNNGSSGTTATFVKQ